MTDKSLRILSERQDDDATYREVEAALRANRCTDELAFWLSTLHRRVIELTREVEKLRGR